MMTGTMINGLAGRIARVKPGYLICALIAIEAVVALLFVPVPISNYKTFDTYNYGFVDDYNKIGWMLREGYGFRFTPDTGATLTREPGYPLLLAGIFWLFGYGLMAVRAVNLICAGLAAWVTSRLAARISVGKAAPTVAAFLFLIHPGFFVADLRGGPEVVARVT